MASNPIDNSQTAFITIAENVYQKLQAAIVEGEISSGTKISEPSLAKKMGISRGPLREALSRLEAGNLIERTPNVGARVISISCKHFSRDLPYSGIIGGVGSPIGNRKYER